MAFFIRKAGEFEQKNQIPFREPSLLLFVPFMDIDVHNQDSTPTSQDKK